MQTNTDSNTEKKATLKLPGWAWALLMAAIPTLLTAHFAVELERTKTALAEAQSTKQQREEYVAKIELAFGDFANILARISVVDTPNGISAKDVQLIDENLRNQHLLVKGLETTLKAEKEREDVMALMRAYQASLRSTKFALSELDLRDPGELRPLLVSAQDLHTSRGNLIAGIRAMDLNP